MTMATCRPKFWVPMISNRALGVLAAAMLAILSGVLADADEPRTRDDSASGAPGAQMSYLRPAPARPGAYRLGINVQNSPVGVQVIEVGSGTLAKSAGLEVGDTIVAVGGYQVGYVGERLFDLGDELARRVDVSESVTLLVRHGRTGDLANVPVQFASATRSVAGRLFFDGKARLPASGVLVVRVVDVTHPEWENVSVVQAQFPAGEFPVSYQLVLPTLAPGHRYAVDARGEHGGRIVLQTSQPTPLAAVDRDQQVDLVLTTAAATGVSSSTGLAPVARPTGPPAASGLVPVTATPRSTLQPRDQIDQWIRAYLGRPPRNFETDVWVAELMRGRSLSSVQAGILSSTELFERVSRSPDLYVAEVYRLLTGSQPTPSQFADLRKRFDQALGVRLQFVEGLIPPSR